MRLLPVAPRSTGEEAAFRLQWLLCSSWGLISGKISGDKVCSVFSVQCPHLSQDIHIRAANVGTKSPVSSALSPARSGLASWLNLFTLIKNSKCLHPGGEVILGVRSLMILE